MPLIYAGIDEAGYGPLLGPLCVGMAAFRVEEWTEGAAAPDLWSELSAAVCRETRDPKRRIAVDDSKKLKGSNSSTTRGGRHPLTHLERGVLSFLEGVELTSDAAPPGVPVTDLAFFDRVGVKPPDELWYAGEPAPCPASTSPEAIGIAANTLRLAITNTKIQPIALRCQAMGEGVFNELVAAAGTKAAATEAALTAHLWTIWDRWGTIGAESGGGGGGVRVICDRQGGRSYYTDVLSRAFPGVAVAQTHHSETQSRYELTGKGADGENRHMHVLFLVESERHHLPVALASMLAKLTRETLMARFNRFWCARMPELKPTAGYRNDAWRWLEEAKSVIAEDERTALMRRA